MTDHENVGLAAIDGRDALAYVLIRPGADEGGVIFEGGARGISKTAAAWILRKVADRWEAEEAGAAQ